MQANGGKLDIAAFGRDLADIPSQLSGLYQDFFQQQFPEGLPLCPSALCSLLSAVLSPLSSLMFALLLRPGQ